MDRPTGTAEGTPPRRDWASWLHGLWRVGMDARDVTSLAPLTYEALLDQPGVVAVVGARWSGGRLSYVRHLVRGTDGVITRQEPGADENGDAPPAGERGPLTSEQDLRAPGAAERQPEGPLLAGAGAVAAVRCAFALADGDTAALWAGTDTVADEGWTARTGERLRQVAEVLVASDRSILEARAHDRRQAQDAFLAEASLQMDASLDVQETLARVARMAVPAVAEGCVVHLLTPDGRLSAVASAHMAAGAQTWLRGLAEGDPWLAKTLLRGAGHRDGLVLRGAELDGGPFGPHGAGPGAAVRALSVSPLTARGRALGTLTFLYHRTEEGQTDPRLLTDLASRAALAIDTTTLYEQRRRHVEVLQRHLLPPSLPRAPGVGLSAAYRVADNSLDVGGDFYDAIRVGDRMALVIGDVCGRGAEAAAFTGQARHTLRTLLESGTGPGPALSRLNRALTDQKASRFVTALIAVLTPAPGGGFTVEVASAGHPQPYVRRAQGEVTRIDAQGMLLGVVDEVSYRTTRAVLEPGDALVLYTDGLTEARAADGTFFEAHLPEHVRRHAALGEDAATRLIDAAAAFRATGDDDTAVLIAEVKDGPR